MSIKEDKKDEKRERSAQNIMKSMGTGVEGTDFEIHGRSTGSVVKRMRNYHQNNLPLPIVWDGDGTNTQSMGDSRAKDTVYRETNNQILR